MQRNSGSMQPMMYRNGQIIAGRETYILQGITPTGEEQPTFLRMKSNNSY